MVRESQAAVQELEKRLAEQMRKSQAGDSDTYQELLRSLAPLMRKFVHKTLLTTRYGDDGSVEDLVQETLLAVHLKRHTYDPDQKFLPWVYTIARYKAIDRLRLKGAQRRLVENLTTAVWLEETEVASPDSSTPEASQALTEALAKLPENQKRALELTKLQELSTAEAAARTGLSESNIKVLTHRALKTLKRHLAGGSDGDR